VRFRFPTPLASSLTVCLKRKNSKNSSTYSFRQAPFRPLAHYIEMESALFSAHQHDQIALSVGNDVVVDIAVGIESGLTPDGAGFEPVTTLVPVTELVASATPSATSTIELQFVSVRRGWNNRFVNRLASHTTSVGDAVERPVLSQNTGISTENAQTKAVPTLLQAVDNNERNSNSWELGIPQALRSSSVSRLLSRLAGVPVHLVRLNALSLARFDFDRDIASRTPTGEALRSRVPSNRLRAPTSARFLSRLEQEMGSRFSAASGMLPDLLRLGFIAVYLKNAGVLAQLLASSLARLPRNRKEIPFIRFRIKVVKVLVSARPEMLGVRISFKGRVARWNRTKVLIGESGRLALYTYSSRLEGGRAQAITRKGTRGVRVWLAYHPSFAKRFRPTLLAFRRSNA
jgi:hypothetical protein